jgi:eukaryotic-like serine/threonine-protein kinase
MAMSADASRAFISYSREDSEFVLRLAEDLRVAGAGVWLDQLDIEPGHEWDSAIEKALSEAGRMLLVLSPSSTTSKNVRDEISFALEGKKAIIPILHRDCAIPLQLHRVQRVDFRTDYARGLSVLLKHLGVKPVAVVAKAPVEAVPPVEAFPNTTAEVSIPAVQKVTEVEDAATPSDDLERVGFIGERKSGFGQRWKVWTVAAVVFLLVVGGGAWVYHRGSGARLTPEEAVPQITSLLAERKPLAGFDVLERAERYSPSDPQLKEIAGHNGVTASITSSPSGAVVEMQDYLTPDGPWRSLGATPLKDVRIPKGYFRWKISKTGGGELVVASVSRNEMNFGLDASLKSPPGMVLVPGSTFGDSVSFVGWIGPYKLPPYFVDRYEVTNRDYQKFVDSGGYEKKEYWTERFTRDGHEVSWSDAMAEFRDPTGRPGPSTWSGGHYPEGKADFPVSGVSWYEASAYAAFAGKRLPVLAQWLQMAPEGLAPYAVPVSNLSSNALAPVGTYKGIGPYGTYDMGGNVREWVANVVDDNLRFILGGSWKTPVYMYGTSQAAPPFDRSEDNGFRCVQNTEAVPAGATTPVKSMARDFAKFKPATDDVFRAYQLLYAYAKTPLHATVDGTVGETVDWREEKVEFDTGYRGERMAAYLFLPKNVRPPYQTVLFFPSARVQFIRDNKGGTALGDIKFFDYIVQSGRAVMYPIYENLYERQVKYAMPGGSQNIQMTTDWYKDAARSLDYLATRPDIDSSNLGYLGVSMGSAEGVIAATLLQDRLKTAIFLDGGYFLDPAPPGGDQADFAPRMKKPVLMVNGRYDFTFPLEKSQNPLFTMLGTPPKDKRHVILETPHDVTDQRPQLIRAVLDWLDVYLGRVAR